MKINENTPEGAVLEELGQRLARIRKQFRTSQVKLAEAAGLGEATLRRMEDGQDAQMGSWVKVLRALKMSAALENLLPESFRSPMADVLADRSRSRRTDADDERFQWGDEAP